jgi:4-amino-4-deoxy-L-arabinose transferase-like glycosyltransferase
MNLDDGLRPAHLALLLALAVAVRSVHLDLPPTWDELYHFFAARSLSRDGSLSVDAGQYTRAFLYTHLISLFFRAFGDSIVVARLPSVLVGSLLVFVASAWVGRTAGRVAGLATGLMLCFCLTGIRNSQFARFYALQALCVWTAATACYDLLTQPPSPRRVLTRGIAVALATSLGLHLQTTTLIAAAAVMIWVCAFLFGRWGRQGIRRAWSRFLLAAAVLVSVLAAALGTGFAQELFARFRYAVLWTAADRDNVIYYHDEFLRSYRMLYALLPVAVVAGAWRRSRPTLFCATVFAGAFVLHSLAGQKEPRYLAYAMPFLVSTWGIAASEAYPRLARGVEQLLRAPGRASRALSATAMVVAIGVGNAAYPSVVLRLVRRPVESPPWELALDPLRSAAARSQVILCSNDLKPLYYLGRPCVPISATLLHTRKRILPEFSLGPTGRPVISRPESMARLMRDHPSGLVIIERFHWRHPAYVPPETADYLARHLEPVPLPPQSRLLAFRWARAA